MKENEPERMFEMPSICIYKSDTFLRWGRNKIKSQLRRISSSHCAQHQKYIWLCGGRGGAGSNNVTSMIRKYSPESRWEDAKYLML